MDQATADNLAMIERKEQLLELLKVLAVSPDPEIAHTTADALLLAYINDLEITTFYNIIRKWYA